MRTGFATQGGREALLASARAIEGQSGAEVVIAVRARSSHYLHAPLLAGIAAGTMTLWFQLFSPWEFSLPAILLAPLAVGLLAGGVTQASPTLQRLLTPAAVRDGSVRTAAQSAFFSLGVAETRQRTGLLVYVSCLEGQVEIVLDRGVAAVSTLAGWAEARGALRAAVQQDDASSGAAALLRCGPLLAGVAPRAADDVNELSDTVDVA
jgi:putative membrane protein